MTGEVPIVPVVIVVVVVEILRCHIAFVEILQSALRANERRDLDANMFILLLLFGLSVDSAGSKMVFVVDHYLRRLGTAVLPFSWRSQGCVNELLMA